MVVAGNAPEVVEGADQLARQLDAAGLDVILDDRKASTGVKFKDSELVGVPTIVVVGRKFVEGLVEVKDRRSGERMEIAVDGLLAHLRP